MSGAASHVRAQEDSLPKVSVGLLAGSAGTSAGSLKVRGYEGHLHRRVGFALSVPLRLGGDRFGFVVAPMLQTSKIFHTRRDAYGNPIGNREVHLLGLGGYLGPAYTARLAHRLWLSFGLGIKALYLRNSAFRYAADFYARVPITLLFYDTDKIALCAEIGAGYGASALANLPQPVFNPVTNKLTLGDANPSFGLGATWDFALGISFP
ncbi:MAG: hypothetical protein QM778_19230 [Myxococcales bacterium]